MKTLLDKKIPVSFVRNCSCCKKNEEFEIPETSEPSEIRLEHRFEYHGPKVADVAYIENGEILCIFEICNTHKTSSENRPEPWFEIDAETLIRIANDNCLSQIQIPCIRCEKCEDCVEKEKKQVETEKTYNNELLSFSSFFDTDYDRKRRNINRLNYYRFNNKNNKKIIHFPLFYTGNIKDYHALFKKKIKDYIETYEKQENTKLYKTTMYEYYKNALLNMHNYRGVSDFIQNEWNRNKIDIDEANKLIKKDDIYNPVKMFKIVNDLIEKNGCKKCNKDGYCICDLTKDELELLYNNICLVCKGSKKQGNSYYDCYYCS
jgi:hypothetical protein